VIIATLWQMSGSCGVDILAKARVIDGLRFSSRMRLRTKRSDTASTSADARVVVHSLIDRVSNLLANVANCADYNISVNFAALLL
jgi:hypothetical protein